MAQEKLPSAKSLKEKKSDQLANWLRAAVLGANDGILSVASILCGMVAGNASPANIMLAGVAAVFAGATSMAAGEYISVSSQADMQKADNARAKPKHYSSDDSDELRIASPIIAAIASAASFCAGAIIPLIITIITPHSIALYGIVISSLICLIILGALSAWVGGVKILKPTLRVTFCGALSLAITYLVGSVFNYTV